MNRSLGYDFPRVKVECEFRKVLSLDDAFRLVLKVGKLGRTSFRYDFQVFNADEELALAGSMTVVTLKDGRPAEIPASLRTALAADTVFSA